MKAIHFSERSIPLFFLAVTIVAYGLLLPLTGFYWDDWPFAWTAKFLGPQEFIPAFAQVRPFLGPIFFVTTSLVPPVPLYWQIFALIIRFIAALSAWFALNQVWPRHKRQTLFAALLLLVFPGYSQHWVAFTHINQEWIPFIFYLLSFGFSTRAFRASHIADSRSQITDEQIANRKSQVTRNTIYALLLLIAGVFPTEYFVSIEPLRFLFIWVILSEHVDGFWQRFVQAFKGWLPYMFIWLANGAWLAYFYTIGGYDSLYDVEVVREPLRMLGLFSTGGDAIWKAGLYVWAQVLVLASKAITTPTTLATFGLIVISFILILFYLTRLNPTQTSQNQTGFEPQRHGDTENKKLRDSLSPWLAPAGTEPQASSAFLISALLIGLAGILLGRVPSFAAGLPLTLQSSYDRFMISMMLGGSLFVAGLIELLIRHPRIKMYAFAFLISLGIGQQFFNANIFRRDWAKQQEFYWQLAWRIPALKPNTALLTHQMPIDYETDLSFTAPINWMYAPAYEGGDVPYALFYTEKRLGGGALPSLEPNVDISLPVRRVSFHGSTSQAIVIYMPRNGCLRVLDPARGDKITYTGTSRFLVDAIPLSDLSNIIIGAGQTARISFLPEPEHTWCYYFSKAELAYQQKNWDRVIDLIDEARSLGYKPEDPLEWLTYIEAQALTGKADKAAKLSNDVFKQDDGTRKGLCEVWKRVQAEGGVLSEAEMHADQVLSDLQCPR